MIYNYNLFCAVRNKYLCFVHLLIILEVSKHLIVLLSHVYIGCAGDLVSLELLELSKMHPSARQ
jgi:hypothetical protein